MRSRLAFAAAMLLTLCACGGGPADTVAAFHKALSLRDGKSALGLLSAATRAELARRAEAAEKASGGTVRADPAQMITRGDLALYPGPGPAGVEAVKASLLSSDEKKARVEVTLGEARHEVELTRESGGWRLVVPLPPLQPESP